MGRKAEGPMIQLDSSNLLVSLKILDIAFLYSYIYQPGIRLQVCVWYRPAFAELLGRSRADS